MAVINRLPPINIRNSDKLNDLSNSQHNRLLQGTSSKLSQLSNLSKLIQEESQEESKEGSDRDNLHSDRLNISKPIIEKVNPESQQG